jgi:hypothetical protein
MSAYIDIFEKDYMESRSEVKKSLVYTSISLLILFIVLMLTHFNILPAIPEDIPPLKSDEVIELFEVPLNLEESGSRGGGTSSDAPIDQPQDQTERMATSPSSDFTTPNGKSNNQNSNNSNNPTSTTVRGTNYFGTGGSGGGTGSGDGLFKGPGSEPYDNPPKYNEKPRVRLNNVSTPQYDIDVDCRVGLKLTINPEGIVTDCRPIKSVTTCTNQSIINDVIRLVKQQVRFNKDPGSPLVQADYTIRLNAR